MTKTAMDVVPPPGYATHLMAPAGLFGRLGSGAADGAALTSHLTPQLLLQVFRSPDPRDSNLIVVSETLSWFVNRFMRRLSRPAPGDRIWDPEFVHCWVRDPHAGEKPQVRRHVGDRDVEGTPLKSLGASSAGTRLSI